MRKVLHVGPCDTPGGMATVMRTLAEFPPEGWEAELLARLACTRRVMGVIGGLFPWNWLETIRVNTCRKNVNTIVS